MTVQNLRPRLSGLLHHWPHLCTLYQQDNFIFLIGIVGGGVQFGPLGTAATNRPIVQAPGDYDDGEIG
jgi:hypothetical protein